MNYPVGQKKTAHRESTAVVFCCVLSIPVGFAFAALSLIAHVPFPITVLCFFMGVFAVCEAVVRLSRTISSHQSDAFISTARRASSTSNETIDEASPEGTCKLSGQAAVEFTVAKGELIPCYGEVIEGFALVDESAIAGVSTPAIIEAQPGRNQVYAGTRVVHGSIKIRCSGRPRNK